MNTMIELDDANGKCHVDPTCIQAISGPVKTKYNPESRKLVLDCSYIVYILNSESNCAVLGIPYETMEYRPPSDEEEDAPAPKRRARKPAPWMRRGSAPKAGQ
jgi:hypothetical protein